MNTLKYSIAMLAAGGALGAAATASAATEVYDYSGKDIAQDVDIMGSTQYTYGLDPLTSNSEFKVSGADAYLGSYSETMSAPASDTYDAANVKQTTAVKDTSSGVFVPTYQGDSYLNLRFAIDGTTYYGTADFKTNADDVTLHSITYNSAAPEPSTWALLIAGVGLSGAALRRGRRQAALAA
jgi:hypothetical protein